MKYIILPFKPYFIEHRKTAAIFFKPSQSRGRSAGFGGPNSFAGLQVVGVVSDSPNLKSKRQRFRLQTRFALNGYR